MARHVLPAPGPAGTGGPPSEACSPASSGESGSTRDGAPIRFSVVIPARNEVALLPATLQSLDQQDFAGRYEVIVVDNASTDRTAEVARARGVRVITEDRRGVCQARQAGTLAARGEIVVSTDADTVHRTDWLRRIDQHFVDDPHLVAIGGGCRFIGASWWARAYPFLLFNGVGLGQRLTGQVWYVSAANLSFRRAAWSGYDLNLTQGGDELDQLHRLQKVGRVAFDPSLLVDTSARRLNRGLLYNLVITLAYYYLLGYIVNRVTGRPLLPMAPEFRTAQTGRRIRSLVVPFGRFSRRLVAVVTITMLTLIMMAWPTSRAFAGDMASHVHSAVIHLVRR